MNSFAIMAVLIVVVAVILIGVFIALWTRDKSRSDEVADDGTRLDTDQAPHKRPGNGR